MGLALMMTACAANPVEVVQPLAPVQRGNVEVVDIDVALSESAAERMVAFDEKAAQTRLNEGLAPYQGGAAKPVEEHYETLPFTVMFGYVMEDVLREKGVTGAEKVRVAVDIDTLKTANAAMMWLAGDSDQLSGLVTVYDAADNQKLSEFYVDTTNNNAGLLGIAMRGSGIRERLSAEFAAHVADQLLTEAE
jgi:hypothetical protein